jgi:hypothetical protein
VNRIEISPLFKISQDNNVKYINPLVRIFKATNENVTEHTFVPLNGEHLNHNRYQRHDIDKNKFNPNAQMVLFISPVPIYSKLSPELHRFDYVY